MTLKIEFATPGFFAIPLKQVRIESYPGAGRVYFVHRDEIVAVARPVPDRAREG